MKTHRPAKNISGSLNYLNRKQEAEKIEHANIMIHERLRDTQPFLHKSQFDEHYSTYRRFQQKMSKAGQIEKSVNYLQ